MLFLSAYYYRPGSISILYMTHSKTDKKKLQDGEFLTDWLERDILMIKWVGFCTPEIYQYGFLKAIALTTERKAVKWLLDFSDIMVISPENQKWTCNILIPKVNSSGIQKVAVVQPCCELATTSIEHMFKEYEHTVKYERKVFEEIEEAEKWLEG